MKEIAVENLKYWPEEAAGLQLDQRRLKELQVQQQNVCLKLINEGWDDWINSKMMPRSPELQVQHGQE